MVVKSGKVLILLGGRFIKAETGFSSTFGLRLKRLGRRRLMGLAVVGSDGWSSVRGGCGTGCSCG